MRTRLTLRPTQDGAKQLYDRDGERLICVRYRYDERKKRRWKTVELIVEESPWEPTPQSYQHDTIVALQVTAQERSVRQHIKAAGGKWNPKDVVWELPYGQALALGLTARIVPQRAAGAQPTSLHIDGSTDAKPSTNR